MMMMNIIRPLGVTNFSGGLSIPNLRSPEASQKPTLTIPQLQRSGSDDLYNALRPLMQALKSIQYSSRANPYRFTEAMRKLQADIAAVETQHPALLVRIAKEKIQQELSVLTFQTKANRFSK